MLNWKINQVHIYIHYLQIPESFTLLVTIIVEIDITKLINLLQHKKTFQILLFIYNKYTYLLSFAIARTSAKTQTSCSAFLNLFRTESHGHSDDWNASLLSESDLESSAPSSFFTSKSPVLLKSIFWAYLAKLSESVKGLWIEVM